MNKKTNKFNTNACVGVLLSEKFQQRISTNCLLNLAQQPSSASGGWLEVGIRQFNSSHRSYSRSS